MNSHYYVYRVGHTKPTIRHHTLASAANEAERLSSQHPGETFEILQCLAVTRTVLAKTFWMDGVTPPHSFREFSGENTQTEGPSPRD